MSSNNPDVITLTEICPKNVRDVNSIATAIQIPGYDLFANDMKTGGIAIQVIKDLHANMEEGLDDELVEENLWVSVELCGRDKLLMGSICRSHNSTEENNGMLFTLIKGNAAHKEFTHHLITGYFNAKETCWETWSTYSSDKIRQELLECLGHASLTQKVEFCTRVRECQNPSLIDLVLENEDDTVHNVASEPPIGLSDHVVVAFDVVCYYSLEYVEKVWYQCVSGDYETMEEEMKGVNWDE